MPGQSARRARARIPKAQAATRVAVGQALPLPGNGTAQGPVVAQALDAPALPPIPDLQLVAVVDGEELTVGRPKEVVLLSVANGQFLRMHFSRGDVVEADAG